LFEGKLKSSTEFKALFNKLISTDFTKLVGLANNSKEFQSLLQMLRVLNVDKYFELVAEFFGWGL
jgi:hypothetical protein